MTRRRWAPALAVLAWALLPYLLAGRLSLSVFVFTFLHAPIVIGLSLLAGYAGQVSLGQAAFYGLGAYVTGILTARLGLSPWLGMPAAVLATAAVAYLLGRPVLLLRGHYLVLATLALNVVVETVMRQAQGLTGGANGLTGIPSLSLAGMRLAGDRFFYYAAGLVTALAAWLSANLVRSRVGRALLAIHASETAAESLGVDPAAYKARVFVWSAALAAASGALYAHYLNFVSPSPFAFTFSVELLMMAVIGGVASIPGAVLGAALAVLVREGVREVVPRLAAASSAEYEIVVFGVLLALFAIAAPEGVWPRLAARRRRAGGEESRWEGLEPRPLDLQQPAGGEPLLVVEDLSRRFGGLQAVRSLSFQVRPGEVLALIGPNGAGKTTVFNLISGVLRPSAGRVILAGRRVDGWPAFRVAALGVARTFQTPRLCPSLTALENVMLGLHRHLRSGFLPALAGRTAAEERLAAAHALAALELVGAAHLAAKRVDTLPFGAQRAVELARALAARPRLLLLDEPGSGLTAAEKERLAEVIRRVRAAGVAVVLVEHDLGFVAGLADRVVVLHHGELLAAGRFEEVRRDPRVVEAYVGPSRAAMPEAGRTLPDAPPAEEVRAVPAPGGDGVPPLLRAADIRAGYGRLPVLHGVDFEVRAGELVAILGPNGAGKTTLMRAVAGLLPCRGEVWLDGRAVGHLPAERRPALGLVLVPERRQLMESMTVYDHLVLGAYTRYRRGGVRAIREDLDRVFEIFPVLAEKRRQPARALSGGQQQMLAIARALMARPRVLLLDEPLLGLAPRVVEEILRVLDAMRRQGPAVVVVEQNAAAVLPHADRAYVLEGGRVALAGTAGRLLRAPELQALFLGGAPREGGGTGR